MDTNAKTTASDPSQAAPPPVAPAAAEAAAAVDDDFDGDPPPPTGLLQLRRSVSAPAANLCREGVPRHWLRRAAALVGNSEAEQRDFVVANSDQVPDCPVSTNSPRYDTE